MTVDVSDMRGNNSEAALQFKIENHSGGETALLASGS